MIRLFEMFAGYGGASFALKRAGIEHEVVGYSEIAPGAIACYQKNFPNAKNYGDCSKIDTATLPDFDLLCGGFPCQTFSIMGSREGFEDTRGTLFRDILRIAEAKKPKYMLLENVEGLVNHEGGKTLRIIKNSIIEKGYDICEAVLNSADYGTPQNRWRVYLVCKLGKFDFMEFQFPIKETKKATLRSILEPNSPEELNVSDVELDKITRYSKTFQIWGTLEQDLDKPSSCIISSYGDRPYSPYFKDGARLRFISPKEAFRLMGFNDEINLEGLPYDIAVGLAGNGWDINLVSRIFKRMNMTSKPKDIPIIINIPPSPVPVDKAQREELEKYMSEGVISGTPEGIDNITKPEAEKILAQAIVKKKAKEMDQYKLVPDEKIAEKPKAEEKKEIPLPKSIIQEVPRLSKETIEVSNTGVLRGGMSGMAIKLPIPEEKPKDDMCFICRGFDYYRDNNGVYHNCPRCNKEGLK